MIHIQFQDTEGNVGFGVGEHENNVEGRQSISGISVPLGYKVTFKHGNWKSYPFHEGMYSNLYLYKMPTESPDMIIVEETDAEQFAILGVSMYVVKDKLGKIKSVFSTKRGRPRLKHSETITTEYAVYKLPIRDKAYLGGKDFPDNDIDYLDIPAGFAAHVFHDKGNPGDVYKNGQRDNAYREYTGFSDLKARSLGNHVSAIRVNSKELFTEEKQTQEEERIQGKIVSMFGQVKDSKGFPRARVFHYATTDFDFGKIEEDWQDWLRSAEDPWDCLMLSARHGAPIAGFIAGHVRKLFFHGGVPRQEEPNTSFRPPIIIEKHDGTRIEIDKYTDVVFHEVEPLRGIYYLYDWIEWLDGKKQVVAVNTADIKRLWRKEVEE